MKRALLLLLLAGACSKSTPQIDAFSADPALADEGTVITLRWSVRGASKLSITPDVGLVDGSSGSAAVTPATTTTYTLVATNNGPGFAQRDVTVTINPKPRAARIASFWATPSQITNQSTSVTLHWSVSGAASLKLQTPFGDQDVSGMSSFTLTKAAGTPALAADLPEKSSPYALVATSLPGLGDPAPANLLLRRAPPPAIASFSADNAAVAQGTPVTLSWTGTATSWSVIPAGGSAIPLGAQRTLTVRPQPPQATYTLVGTGPGGVVTSDPLTVSVNALPGVSLSYDAPVLKGESFQLVADPCGAPCTSMTFHVRPTGALRLHGVAFDLPLDASKLQDVGNVSLGFADPISTPTGTKALGAVKIGRASPSADLLLFASSKAGGSPSDVDVDASTDLGSFTLALDPSGGAGVVFGPGASDPTTEPRFRLSAHGTGALSGLAVGTLTVSP